MDVSTLPNDPAQLRGIIAKMAARHEAAVSDLAAQYEVQLADKDQYIADLQEQVRLLRALRYAAQSEKAKAPHHEQQFYLFDEAEVAQAQGEDLESEVSEVAAHLRKKGGRRPISPDYPRVEVVHDIPDEDKVCACGCQLTRIGEEVSEKLDIVPQKIQVIRHIRPKYACRACEGVEGEGPTVKIAALPPQIIPQGGLSTKIHASTDALGNPTRFILTGGERPDCEQAANLLADQEADAVLADKGYDADYIVDAVKRMKAEVVIPPRSNRKVAREYDAHLYKERNLIERMYDKLKHF